jgi:UDP-4-amino-4,6-dideoxy-N-acetyl-beta-L-altrosamine N-acetyltransferase
MRKEDLETVLKWRNSEHIRRYAISKETISIEQHIKWFHTIKARGDLYFVIENDNKQVGLIWANKLQVKSCETGMYIYDTSMQNSLFSYKVSLALNDYLFNTKNLDSISCEILNDNSRSIRFTLSLGYKEVEKNDMRTKYLLSNIAFTPHFEKISKLLNKSTKA